MVRLKLDLDVLSISSIVEHLIKVKVKDCFEEDDTLYVVVDPGQLGKAIGKGGVVIKKAQQQLNKKMRMIEYSDNLANFVQNIIYPLRVEQVVEENGIILIKDSDRRVKSQIIGRDGKNLALIKRAVQRFFPVQDVKVV